MSNWYDDMQKELNKNKMEYPQEFVDKCLSVFPEDEEIKTLLDDKSFLLGEALQKKSKQVISTEELAKASEIGTTEEVVKKAKTIEGAKELFANFIDLYDEQYRSKGYFITAGLVGYSDGILLDYKVRKGEIKVKKIKIDPVAQREADEALRLILEQNAARRREGERIAGEFWCR